MTKTPPDLPKRIVLTPQYQDSDKMKLFLDRLKHLPCDVIDDESPYYLRLKVAASPQDDTTRYYFEMRLPHHAVLYIAGNLLKDKKLGFEFPTTPERRE
jgi:hypothetical protein